MTAGVFISARRVRVARASVEEYSVLDVQWRTVSHTGGGNHHAHRFVAWYVGQRECVDFLALCERFM